MLLRIMRIKMNNNNIKINKKVIRIMMFQERINKKLILN